jgi:hypothetical protein
MKTEEEKQIAEEYKEFVDTAATLAENDILVYPLEKSKFCWFVKIEETKRDRMREHLIGMIQMHQDRYGDSAQRMQIVTFLENQLFPAGAKSPEMMCHLSYEIWQDLRESILRGEYRILDDKGEKKS